MLEKDKIKEVLDKLEEAYPEAECALHHQNVFQLIVAVALSAQTTDKSVNVVTPALFERYPDAEIDNSLISYFHTRFVNCFGDYYHICLFNSRNLFLSFVTTHDLFIIPPFSSILES